jgi:hypothetical protein
VAQQFYNFAQLWRLKFEHPPIFWKSAYILEIRLYFRNSPRFWKSAYILRRRLYFEQAPIFYDFAFVAANICVYFQYLFMHFVCANIFVAIVLSLGLRLML